MSRVTNSVLLRYGINTFWSSWSFSNKLLNSSIQLNCFFSIFLRNYFFKLLKIQYSNFLITLYIFDLRDQKLSFLEKYLKLNKILKNNLYLRKNYSLRSDVKDSIKINKKISFLHLYRLGIMTFYLISIIKGIHLLKHNQKGNFNLSYEVPKCSNVLRSKSCLFFVISKQTYSKRVKIKLINTLIKLKLLALNCSLLIFFYTNKRYFVNFKPLTEKKQDFKLPFLFNIKSWILKQRLYIVYLSLLFVKASILNFYINILIREIKDKKHINVIRLLFDNIKVLFQQQILPIAGIKFQISGRLNGKLRKSRFGYNIGSIKLMSFSTFCNYSCDFVYTQYGSFSLKLWLCVNTENSLIS